MKAQRETIQSPALRELRELLGPRRLLTGPLAEQLYKYDAAFEMELPLAVALPENAEEVARVVGVCAREGVPLVPRGAGTSLSGGAIPSPGSVVLSLARMNRILEIDPGAQVAVVQPGVVNLNLQNALEPQGYFYAPDPASQLVSTLGGNLGHNAGGPHCLKYGVTSHHILGVEMVTATGERVRLGSRALETGGYNLLGLVVGGEGTLGIATEIACRLLPLPEALGTALAVFDSLEEASETVSGIIAAGIVPAALEMLDQPLMAAVEQHVQAGYPLDAAAVLLVEVDGPPAAITPQMAAIEGLCNEHHARDFRSAYSPEERAVLWRGRKGAAAAVANLAPGKLSTDVVVPREVLPEMVRQVTEIGRRQELIIGVLLHAGDGNLHPQIVFNPRDTEQLARVRRAQEEIVRAALSLGGAMTGEHGVGSEKRHFMNLVFGPGELALMAGIKRAFDPRGLMNPGKLLPDETPEEAERPAVPEGTFEQVAPEITVRDEQGRWRPRDYEAVSKFLALANRDGRPVRIMGAGIGHDLRSPLPAGQAEPEREVLCTLSLGRLLHLEAANLTVTVQAGMRLGELQQALAEAGQWWPVIPPGGAEATIGGILAGGMSGPLAARYGRLQDLVTGVKFALPSGEVLRFGLPCVKNVAGYAVERLMVGSRGTLGALLELTLRTLPLPERRQTVRVTGGDLETFRVRLQANGTRPAAVEPQGEGLLVALQGMESEVEALEETVAALASETGAEPQPAEEELWTLVAAGRRERLAPPPPGAEEFSRRLKELFDPRGILPGP